MQSFHLLLKCSNNHAVRELRFNNQKVFFQPRNSGVLLQEELSAHQNHVRYHTPKYTSKLTSMGMWEHITRSHDRFPMHRNAQATSQISTFLDPPVASHSSIIWADGDA